MAPRRLQPQTCYIAALVPTFSAGALAGLGRSDQEVAAALAAAQPAFAWSTSDTSVDLPVYLHWEFSCGAGGDFESLARSLHEVPVPPTFGTRPLDLGLAGAGMPVTTGLSTVFRGALTAPGIAAETAWPDPAGREQESVDTPGRRDRRRRSPERGGGRQRAAHGRPAVGPLLYARAAAGRMAVDAAGPAQNWFDQLNRDPRARAVAGIATRVLRRDVEDVMARAWQQIGQVEEANAVLRRLQVSRAGHSEHAHAAPVGVSAGPPGRPPRARCSAGSPCPRGDGRGGHLRRLRRRCRERPSGRYDVARRGHGLTSGHAARRPGRLRDAGAEAPAGSDASGRLLTALTAGIAEPDVLPDGTVGIAPPARSSGAAATSAHRRGSGRGRGHSQLAAARRRRRPGHRPCGASTRWWRRRAD